MEFLCLNCFESFNVDEKNLPNPGEMLTCPVCGHKQPFAGVKTRKTTTSGRRRASGEYHMSATDGSAKAPGLRENTTARARRPASAPDKKTVSERAIHEEHGSSYTVVSPSGLSFDFQDLHMLVRWGEMVANPVPYQVYRDGKAEAISLEEILNDKSSIRKFKKRTMKMKQVAEAEAAATGIPANDSKDKESETDKKSARPLTTKEFQFKTEVVEEKKWPMLVIYLILSALFGAAALFAFYVYFMHGTGK